MSAGTSCSGRKMAGSHSEKDELEAELLTTTAGNSHSGSNTRGWGSRKNAGDSMAVICSGKTAGSNLRKNGPDPDMSTTIAATFQQRDLTLN